MISLNENLEFRLSVYENCSEDWCSEESQCYDCGDVIDSAGAW